MPYGVYDLAANAGWVIRVSNEDMASLNIHRDPFHGGWNCTIEPRKSGNEAFVL